MKLKRFRLPSNWKKFFTIRRAIIVGINLLIIVMIFLGVKRLLTPPEEVAPPSKKEGLPLPEKLKEVVKKETGEKKPKKAEGEKKEAKPEIPLMPKTQEEVPVKVYKLAPVDFTDELPAVGTVKSVPALELKFETNGVIQTLNVKEGDKVRKGDTLATLNPRDVKLEIEWAQAKLDSARAEYNAALKRYQVVKKLYEVGAIIKDRLDQAQAEVDVAKAKIEIAHRELALSKAKMKKLQLLAPQDGIIGKKEKDVGEFVTPNDVVLTLLDPQNTYVEVGIIEKDVYKIKTGQRVKVKVDTYPTRIFFGYVENIFPEIDERTRTMNVRIRVLDPGRLLKPGMFARADIGVFSKRNALVVPSISVAIQRGAYYAGVVEENKVVYKKVSVEYITTDYAVIKKGLLPGDLVITETPGMKRLNPGTGVKIIETQEKLF
ncbi:MAG: efflux RND transporter periplasmic adaptor subunit [Candidatus Omnitrophica bacterium]|nr:efflux RND transporter periplasmic adaptor subunit [Candidatus Omnitrophota bacterium]